MEISQLAAVLVSGTAAITQENASMSMVKKSAQAQMQMANVLAQQATQVNSQAGFSVYA
jgi:hypothetical protein